MTPTQVIAIMTAILMARDNHDGLDACMTEALEIFAFVNKEFVRVAATMEE